MDSQRQCELQEKAQAASNAYWNYDALKWNQPSDPKTQIQNDQTAAEKLKETLDGLVEKDQSALDSLNGQIKDWGKTISDLENNPDSQKDPAKTDLAAAKAKLTALENQASALKADISSLTGLQTKEAADISQFDALLKNPTADNAKKADALLSDVKGVDSQAEAAQQDFTSKTPSAADITAMSATITKVQDDLDPSAGIQKDQKDAQAVIDAMKAATAQDQKALDALTGQIAAWQKQITALEGNPGSQKDPAKTDLAAAKAMLAKLQAAKVTASADLTALQGNLTTATTDLAQFSTITTKAAADALLAKISALNTQSQFTKDMPSKAQTDAMTAAIAKVQADLQPTPSGGKIENSVWVKSWGPMPDLNKLPPGVNTINLFEGKLDKVNGKWVIDGVGQMTDAQLKAYIAAAHAKGITVKISLGGAGGQGIYNNTWDQMTDGNVQQMGKDLADYCKSIGLDGVDFDYEEQKSQAQRQQVGHLINAFKTADPSLKATVCTDADAGWASDLKDILDAAKNPDGSTPVDRLYIMSYDYRFASSAETEQKDEGFMTQWEQFAKQYGMSPSQVSLGTDPTDASMTDADREKLLKFAADHGYGTALWDQCGGYNEGDYTQNVHDIYWKEYNRVHPHNKA